MAVHVHLDGVTKTYRGAAAVKDLDLDIEEGKFTCLLGPSGCGKTTTLRMIAGFVDPDGGEVYIRGKPQSGVPPHRRPTSIVFQEYALFPHMTVFENVAYGLRVKGTAPAAVKVKVEETLGLLGLSGLDARFPRQLSGGQQQRVALARSLIMEPEVLLMDEPLSNLDAKLRVRVRTELKEIQRRLGITTIYVTHDQEEALSIADKVAVMDQGVLKQYGTPWELYHRPADRFVADFIGLNNFLPGKVAALEGELALVEVAGGRVRAQAGGCRAGQDVWLAIRPEHLRFGGGDNSLAGEVKASSFLGPLTRHWLDVGGHEVMVDEHSPSGPEGRTGRAEVAFSAAAARLFSA